MISCSNADELLFAALSDVFTHGLERSPREHETLEVRAWSATLRNPRARLIKNEARDVRKGYCAASVAWNLAHRNDVESIVWWNPGGRYISDDGTTFHGANYGDRWSGYLEEAMFLLDQDNATRRAWVPIWQPTDLEDEDMENPRHTMHYSRQGKDVPCTLGFILERRDGFLDMEVVMRSQNTMVLPYDLFLFSVMQELIAKELVLRLGVLYWHAISLHLYRRREYAMNRSTYEWYRDMMYAAKHHNYEWHRKMQEPMEPIGKTLYEAKREWPSFMTKVMQNMENAEMLSAADIDPIERLMVTDAIRKHSETKEAVV